MISLRPLTDGNRSAIEALRIRPAQERFVNTVTDALLEAVEEPGGRAIQFGLYDDDTPVGFVMISDTVDEAGYISQYLWKLLIDREQQRRGGRRAAPPTTAGAPPAPGRHSNGRGSGGGGGGSQPLSWKD